MVYLTRRERFNAAHRLYREDFSDEKNVEIFGKCSNPLWHGHNYELFVTVCGPVNLQTGFVMNLKLLSKIINDYIIEKFDHKNLNLEVDFMKGKMISTENIAIAVWEQINAPIAAHNVKLHCVKICETENNYVEYFGE
ncbi:MAG: 6-carboxytetrahydropterin synthase [Bacteroidales bacterium]|jgi:6-pyruvoyltetrahydropterin/6-carboxytetrahydropterin synthase|nr:6-carboxytetrahydropterin synthase [Bacteroidales bacterium]MDD4215166.1 6-carboxytetrahydropterin synthase [Bacteroidales bacterium]